MNAEILIPLLLMVLVAGIIFTYMNNSHKIKLKTHEILEKSIDKGYEMTPEILKGLNQTKSPRMLDLRRGIIILGIALATFIFGWIVPNGEASTVFKAMSLFPGFIGAGFILVWKLNHYSD